MRIVNPDGNRVLVFKSDKKIFLEDLSPGSRFFTLTLVVEGEGTKVEMVGKMHTLQKDKKSWNISVQLTGKNQSAILRLCGVADDDSCIIFDGSGILQKNSENGNMRIEEKVILFSPTASAQALPILRVETAQVQSASHSASITPFSEEIIFFLSSRGISPVIAKEILKEGILNLKSDDHC